MVEVRLLDIEICDEYLCIRVSLAVADKVLSSRRLKTTAAHITEFKTVSAAKAVIADTILNSLCSE